MGIPVVIAENGFGLPVTDATGGGLGVPMTVAENGYGTPVVIVENGFGTPAVFDPPISVPTEPPANLSAPSIADPTPTVGETISCFRGVWSNPPNTFDYQWYRGEVGSDPFVFAGSVSAGAPGGGGTFSTAAIDTTGATLLVICISDYAGAAAATISDSKGNTWTGLAATSFGGDTRSQIYYCSAPASAGASHTVTATGTNYASMTFAAFSGPAAPAFDAAAGAGGNSATASAGAGITPSEDNCLVIANVACPAVQSPSAITAPFTAADIIVSSGNHFGHAMAYSIQTTAAAADPDWTLTGTINWAASIASFKYEA